MTLLAHDGEWISSSDLVQEVGITWRHDRNMFLGGLLDLIKAGYCERFQNADGEVFFQSSIPPWIKGDD